MKFICCLTSLAATIAFGSLSTTASAQSGSPLLPGLAPTLSYGCPWIKGNDPKTNNKGYLDVNASYDLSFIPVNPGAGTRLVYEGRFPRTRYFSFQVYDGVRGDNLIDSLPDAAILPTQGGSLNPNPAALPDNNGYTNRYQVQVLFQNPPARAADRLPNTLYAGSGTNTNAFTKQVLYRTYQPNPGTVYDEYGLPAQFYEGPQGRIDLRNTPDQRRCNTQAAFANLAVAIPTPGVAQTQARLVFTPIVTDGSNIQFPNGDIDYVQALPGQFYGDLVVIRAKAPITAVFPPLAVPDPEVRYFSICQNQLTSTAVIACVADSAITLQSDGYYNVVISSDRKRPTNARPEFGYNWLPFGPPLTTSGLAVIRQLIGKPGFPGSFSRAVANPNMPLSATLGQWAPLITYCDSTTFAISSPSGGAATFAACKSAADRGRLFGGLFGG